MGKCSVESSETVGHASSTPIASGQMTPVPGRRTAATRSSAAPCSVSPAVRPRPAKPTANTIASPRIAPRRDAMLRPASPSHRGDRGKQGSRNRSVLSHASPSGAMLRQSSTPSTSVAQVEFSQADGARPGLAAHARKILTASPDLEQTMEDVSHQQTAGVECKKCRVTFDSEGDLGRQNSSVDQCGELHQDPSLLPPDMRPMSGDAIPAISLRLPQEAASLQVCDIKEVITPSTTPALTPHALTEAALKRSEDLLAELSGLGLGAEESSDGDDEVALASPISRATTRHSSRSRRSGTPKHKDTVEMPTRVLELLLDAWANTKHAPMQETSCSEPEPELLSMASSSRLDSAGASSHATEGLQPCPHKLASPSTWQFQQQPIACRSNADIGPQVLRVHHSPRQVLRQSLVTPACREALAPIMTPRVAVRCTVQQTININTTFHVNVPF